MEGDDAEKIEWAQQAQAVFSDTARRVAEFQASIDTQSRWTMHGLFCFIKENSQMKALMETARNDDLKSTQIVTVGDAG